MPRVTLPEGLRTTLEGGATQHYLQAGTVHAIRDPLEQAQCPVCIYKVAH